jgi:hypothetical protein
MQALLRGEVMSILGAVMGNEMQGLLGTPQGLSNDYALSQWSHEVLRQQQWANQAQQAAGAQIGAQGAPVAPTPAVTVHVKQSKINRQIEKLLDAIPMSLAGHIVVIHFYAKHDGDEAHFVVRYDNDHILKIYEIDEFPSDEHIARIALECP